MERIFTLLPDDPAVLTEWKTTVTAHGVVGVHVHDARLVAFMRVYGISRILTLNGTDFARYPGVSAIHPVDV